MVRSVLSVLAGVAALTAASFAIEAVVNPLLLRAFPGALPGPAALASNHWVRAFTVVYGFICVAAGGYVSARIARRFPIRRDCDGNSSGWPDDSGDAIAGRKPCFTTAMDHDCYPERPSCTGGRITVQGKETR